MALVGAVHGNFRRHIGLPLVGQEYPAFRMPGVSGDFYLHTRPAVGSPAGQRRQRSRLDSKLGAPAGGRPSSRIGQFTMAKNLDRVEIYLSLAGYFIDHAGQFPAAHSQKARRG